MTPDERFARCDALIDAWEGGATFTDDPRDRGGPTKHGVTLATLSAWRKAPCTAADVQALTAEEAGAIRRAGYWNKVCGDQLPPGLDLMLYDCAINQGPGVAARMVQDCLGIDADGLIGPLTLAQIHLWPDMAGLVRKVSDRRAARYKVSDEFPTFGHGWISRLDRCTDQSIAWA